MYTFQSTTSYKFSLSFSCSILSAFFLRRFHGFFVIYWQLRAQYKQVMPAITLPPSLSLARSLALSQYVHLYKTVNKSNNQRVKKERTSNLKRRMAQTYTNTHIHTRFLEIRIICCAARLNLHFLVYDWTRQHSCIGWPCHEISFSPFSNGW